MSSDIAVTDDWWESDDAYPVEDWQDEVANGQTRLGYWEWVENARSNAS